MKKKKLDRVMCEDLKDYQMLKDTVPFLKGQANAKMFMLAMSMGHLKNSKIPLKKGKEGLARLDSFSPEDISLIKALAVQDSKEVNTLLDDEKIYSIAEEYANGGIKFLKAGLVHSEGTYLKKLASDLLDHLDRTIKK